MCECQEDMAMRAAGPFLQQALLSRVSDVVGGGVRERSGHRDATKSLKNEQTNQRGSMHVKKL